MEIFCHETIALQEGENIRLIRQINDLKAYIGIRPTIRDDVAGKDFPDRAASVVEYH